MSQQPNANGCGIVYTIAFLASGPLLLLSGLSAMANAPGPQSGGLGGLFLVLLSIPGMFILWVAIKENFGSKQPKDDQTDQPK